MMKISKKKPYITSSVTTEKSRNIKGFQRFTATDEQQVSATPKRKAARSNRAGDAKSAVHPYFWMCSAFLRPYSLGYSCRRRRHLLDFLHKKGII